MPNLVVVQLTDDIQHVQLTDGIQHVQHVQRSAGTSNMIQRSFDRYEIESDEEELDHADNIQRSSDISNMIQRSSDISNMIQRSTGINNMIQRSDEPKLSNMIQRSFDRYEIESDFDESDFDESDEEEYWHSVEQERMKEEYWHLVEQLEEEYGANIPNEDHPLIISTTLSIILEIEQELDDKQELDDESFKKMICNIYPEVCQLYWSLDSLYS